MALPSLKRTWGPYLTTDVLEAFVYPIAIWYHHVEVMVVLAG